MEPEELIVTVCPVSRKAKPDKTSSETLIFYDLLGCK
jgi:hypothetical protein